LIRAESWAGAERAQFLGGEQDYASGADFHSEEGCTAWGEVDAKEPAAASREFAVTGVARSSKQAMYRIAVVSPHG